ncbi:hypothetical protein J7T55_000109 [Diaporthe amygdali]|uniref:uncharacterized protein n=1 Tax=Phomopsis amygdali TaxID=1214568 RepID=UPI0022FF333A|nr:uncharacterized protein J7T55_000109 [Diaporthe amygdali]KAJ0100668.1 hypothetical protein J7T55_000109 [Diaporthe amygdali]
MSQNKSELIRDQITVLFACNICEESFVFVDKLQAHEANHTKNPHTKTPAEAECTLVTSSNPTANAEFSHRKDDTSFRQNQDRTTRPLESPVLQHFQPFPHHMENYNRCSSLGAWSCVSVRLEDPLAMSLPDSLEHVDCSARRDQLVARATGVLPNSYLDTSFTSLCRDEAPRNKQGIRLPPILSDGNFQTRSLPSLRDVFSLQVQL